MSVPTIKQLRAERGQQCASLLTYVEHLLGGEARRRLYGRTPRWTEAQVAEVAQYAQALREVPIHPHFPMRVYWPSTPAILSTLIIS